MSAGAAARVAPAASDRREPEAPAGIRQRDYLTELEGLRGVAILLVVAYHLGLVWSGARRDPAVDPLPFAFVRAGHTGVSLFFVLSAFLLSGPFLAEAGGGRPVDRRRYFGRRALRILPAYYTAVVLVTLWEAHRPMDLLRMGRYLLFLNPFPPTLGRFSRVWWSLATEVQFYLVLPLLPRCLRSRAGWLVLAGYGGLYALFLAGVVPPRGDLAGTLQMRTQLSYSLLGQAPLFLAGALAAWVHRRHGARIREALAVRAWMRRGGADLLLLLVLAALALLLRWVVAAGSVHVAMTAWQAWHVLEGLCWAAVVLLVLLAPLVTKPLVDNAVLRGIGTVSYSLYLVHVAVIASGLALLHSLRPGLLAGGGAAVVGVSVCLALAAIGIATIAYWVIERPFLVRKERLAS